MRVRKDVIRKLVYLLYDRQHYDAEHKATIRQHTSYDTPRAKHWISCTDTGIYVGSQLYDGTICHCVCPPWVYYDEKTKMIYIGATAYYARNSQD